MKGPVDFAVVTALKLEREAVLKRLDGGYQSLQEDNEPLTYYYGHVTIPSSGERYTVVVVMLLGMGNEEAAVATTRVIQRWQPEHVLMVGIAGGVPGKVALGDVVIAESIYYYEAAKLTPRGEERRPEAFVTSRLLYGRAKAYEASEWKGEVDQRPRDRFPTRKCRAGNSTPLQAGECSQTLADRGEMTDFTERTHPISRKGPS